MLDFLGPAGLRGTPTRRSGDDVADVLGALAEPAALCAIDGAVVAANEAWREALGRRWRATRTGDGLFTAFREARRSGRGEGRLSLDGGRSRAATITRAGETRFLLRLAPEAAAAAPAPDGASPPPADGARTIRQDETSPTDAQRRKMEAIGQLAGGVAHDFNNLLSAIGMRVDELLMRHPLGDPAYELLREVREDVNRAAALVLQLLTFSRKATVRREAVDLCEALMEFEVLLRRLLRDDVVLETDYAPGAPRVRVDKAQLEMAVMNLVVNARDALRAGASAQKESGARDDARLGTIRLRVARVAPGVAAALGCPAPAGADMAMIEVADDGPGIPSAVIDSIFEPFFTTKAAGEGTGLGLATVYGIVQQSEGAIVAVSPPGEGATFRIFLPAHAPRLTPPPAPPPPRPAARDLSGAGRILFVEDENRVRDIAARLLRRQGYEVIEACDGEEALELARANAGRIDLMISDVSMPGMDGPVLLEAARPFLGAAPVMFISGYAQSEFSDLLEGEAGVTFLPKPLSLSTLAERVKQRLSAGA